MSAPSGEPPFGDRELPPDVRKLVLWVGLALLCLIALFIYVGISAGSG